MEIPKDEPITTLTKIAIAKTSDRDTNACVLTLELLRQSNRLILQIYFQIPTSCYIFFAMM